MPDTAIATALGRRLDFLAEEPLADPALFDLASVNPLIARPDGVVAVDALLLFRNGGR